jgi:phosphoribosylformylglycinamidine synthase PurS subunit
MRVRVFVRLKGGVLDVQGKAVERGVLEAGMTGISDVRIGKLIEFDVAAASAQEARARAEELCEKVLANPIIENFEIIALP